MKKEEIIRRCYGGMKERHGVETIILFHVGDSFEAYFDDAETITRITEVPRFKMTAAGIPAIRISDAALEECRNRLLDTVGGSGINHRNAEMLSDHGLGQH